MSPKQFPAKIRLWAYVSEGPDDLHTLEYLESLLATELGVRAINPNGLQFFGGTRRNEPTGPWSRYASAFLAPVADRYVNIVCAAPHFEYRGTAALEGLYTVGVPNVAITIPPPDGDPLPHVCLKALLQYDSVLTPSLDTASQLRALGISRACGVSPAGVDALKELCEALLPPTPDRA